MDDGGSLGEVMRARRRELGLTQEALAERIGDGVRQADVSRMERGRVALPRRRRLERIAAALELPVGELLARSGWAGAAAAFDPERRPARPASDPDRAESVPLPHLTQSGGAATGAQGTTDLRAAIERSHELEAWSADLLQRSAATIEAVVRSQPGNPDDGHPGSWSDRAEGEPESAESSQDREGLDRTG
jgi:transcriptional regulator with XRE-family HTH domain